MKIFKVLAYVAVLVLGLGAGGYYYLTSYQESLWGNILHPDKTLILFDFDGTLCDSMEATIRVYNDAAKSFDLVPFSDEDYKTFRSTSTKAFLKEHGVGTVKLPLVAYQMKTQLQKEMPFLSPFEGTKKALEFLKSQGFTVAILTSNSLENVRIFLQKNDLELFEFIYHGSALFGKSALLEKVKEKSNAKHIYYVGDSDRDIHACKKAEIPIVAVTWGHHNRKYLETHDPNFLVDSFQELETLFTSIH